MADFVKELQRDPTGALKLIKHTNPVLKDIWEAIPPQDRAGVEMPTRGFALKAWLENWALEWKEKQHNQKESAGAAPAPTSVPPLSRLPSNAETQQQQPQQSQYSSPPNSSRSIQLQQQPPPQQQQYQQQQYQQQQPPQQQYQPPQQQQPYQPYQQPQQQQYQQPPSQQSYQQYDAAPNSARSTQPAYAPQQQQHQHQAGPPGGYSYDEPHGAPSPARQQQAPSQQYTQQHDDSQYCPHCQQKDAQIHKLTSLVNKLIEQLEDTALEARGNLTDALS